VYFISQNKDTKNVKTTELAKNSCHKTHKTHGMFGTPKIHVLMGITGSDVI